MGRGGRWIRKRVPVVVEEAFLLEEDEEDEVREVGSGRGGEGEGLRERWVWREVRIEEVVLVRTWSAFGGGFVPCMRYRHHGNQLL